MPKITVDLSDDDYRWVVERSRAITQRELYARNYPLSMVLKSALYGYRNAVEATEAGRLAHPDVEGVARDLPILPELNAG